VCLYGGAAYSAEVVHTVSKAAGKPVGKLASLFGLQDVFSGMGETVTEEAANNALLFSGTDDLFEKSTSAKERADSAQRMMGKSLERGLVARMFNFKDGQAASSISALSLPFLVGKSLQTAISLVPGGGIVGDLFGKGAGKATQWVLRKKTDVSNNPIETNDAVTLLFVQQLSDSVSKGFAGRYKTTLSQLSEQQMKDMIHYGSISLLDHIDQVFNSAEDGDAVSVQNISDKVVKDMSNRYMKIDQGVSTLNTMARAAGRGIKRTRGFGSETVGDIMTTPLVRKGDALYIDESALKTDRIDDKKKRGRVKAKRKLSSKFFAARDAVQGEDVSKYRKLSAEEAVKMAPKKIRKAAAKKLAAAPAA
jgi:hypothetical protein